MTCRTNFPELTLLKSSLVPRGSPLAGQIPGEKALLLLRIFIRHGKLVPAPRAGGCRQGLAGLRTFWVLIPDPARMPPVHLSLCPSIHLPVPLSIHPSPHGLLGPPQSCSFHHVPSPHRPRRGSLGPVRGRIPGGAAPRCPGRGGPARGSRSAAAPAARGRTRTGRQERPAPAGQRRREGGELPAGPQLRAALPTRCRFPVPVPASPSRLHRTETGAHATSSGQSKPASPVTPSLTGAPPVAGAGTGRAMSATYRQRALMVLLLFGTLAAAMALLASSLIFQLPSGRVGPGPGAGRGALPEPAAAVLLPVSAVLAALCLVLNVSCLLLCLLHGYFSTELCRGQPGPER